MKANVLFLDARPAQEKPWTKTLWVYDLRTNLHFTQKTNPLKRSDLDEFVECYRPTKRHLRKPTWSEANPEGRWRSYDYDDLIRRDKVNLDIFWLRTTAWKTPRISLLLTCWLRKSPTIFRRPSNSLLRLLRS